jgi:heme exporter protein D
MPTCPECGKQFDLADRATTLTPEASVVQIIYCSVKCKRSAGNRRNYQRHRQARLDAAKKRTQKATK